MGTVTQGWCHSDRTGGAALPESKDASFVRTAHKRPSFFSSHPKSAQYFPSYKIPCPLSPELLEVFLQFLPQSHKTQCSHLLEVLSQSLGPRLWRTDLLHLNKVSQDLFWDKTQNLDSILSLLHSLFWQHSWNLVFCDCIDRASRFSTHSVPSFPLASWKSHPETPASLIGKILWLRILLPLTPNSFLSLNLKITVN